MSIDDPFILRGRFSDPRHIELDEPAPAIEGEVEVIVRAVGAGRSDAVDVFELIASLPPGTRSKADIDHQLAEERDSWGER